MGKWEEGRGGRWHSGVIVLVLCYQCTVMYIFQSVLLGKMHCERVIEVHESWIPCFCVNRYYYVLPCLMICISI